MSDAVARAVWREVLRETTGAQRLALAVLAQMRDDWLPLLEDGSGEWLDEAALVYLLGYWRGFWFGAGGLYEFASEPPETQVGLLALFVDFWAALDDVTEEER